MAQYDALLKIKAQVDGEGAIAGLAKGLGGLKSQADNAGKGLGGMLSSAGGLSGALGSLIPLVSGVGLAAMAKGAIDAADDMNDLAQKTGISVEQLSKFQQAANAGGTSIEAVGGAMVRLSRGMANAGTDTEEYGRKSEEAFRDATRAVEDGEDRQVAAVKDAADKRLEALETETSDRLREINKRYKQEQRLLDDSFTDAADAAETAAKDQQDRESKIIEQRFDARRKAVQQDQSLSEEQKKSLLAILSDQEEESLKVLDRGYQEQQKQRSRQFRDEQQEREDALEERKRKEEEKLKAAAAAAKAITKESADGQVALIKQSTKEQLESLKDLEEGPKGVGAALSKLGISMNDATGKMKATDQIMLEVADKFKDMPDGVGKTALAIQLFGRSGAAMIPMINGGRKAIEDLGVTMTGDFAKAADQFNDKTVAMGAKLLVFGISIGEKLMPHLEKLTDMLISLADGFAALPKWQQETIVAAGALILVLGPLTTAIRGVMLVSQVLMGIKLGATIAGWAGAAGPAMIVIKAVLGGLLTFLTGTLGPALLAFFSGPVGWTVLAVAAVVAMAIAFREPLGKFLTWLGSEFKKGWDKFVNNILKKPLTNYFKWWRSNWDSAVKFLTGLFAGIGKSLKAPLAGVVSIFTNTLRLTFKILENWFNGFVARYNNMLKVVKSSPFGGLLGLIPSIPLLNLPKFAKGGVVSRPTVAMIGEGGESEYVIPESKMGRASMNYLDGARGGAVIPAFAEGGYVGASQARGDAIFSFNGRLLDQKGAEQVAAAMRAEEAARRAAWENIVANDKAALEEMRKQWKESNEKLLQEEKIRKEKQDEEFRKAEQENNKQRLLAEERQSKIVPNISIVVETGPVMAFDNKEYVTVKVLESAMEETARSVFKSLRNPSTRISLGLT
jgi:hypothetical protein